MPVKETINFGKVYFNGVCVGTATDIQISDFTEDRAAVKEYIRNKAVVKYVDGIELTTEIKFNLYVYLKLIGLWDWVKTNCPNKRLVYLMGHGKNVRVRMKNFRRAAREIDKHIKE